MRRLLIAPLLIVLASPARVSAQAQHSTVAVYLMTKGVTRDDSVRAIGALRDGITRDSVLRVVDRPLPPGTDVSTAERAYYMAMVALVGTPDSPSMQFNFRVVALDSANVLVHDSGAVRRDHLAEDLAAAVQRSVRTLGARR